MDNKMIATVEKLRKQKHPDGSVYLFGSTFVLFFICAIVGLVWSIAGLGLSLVLLSVQQSIGVSLLCFVAGWFVTMKWGAVRIIKAVAQAILDEWQTNHK